jgi:HEAT repeat protein
LSDIRDNSVLDHLITLAKDDHDPQVRCAAISGLGNFVYLGGISAYDPETDQEVVSFDGCLPKEDLERVYDFMLSVYRDQERTLEEKCSAVEAQSFFDNRTVEDIIGELYARPEKAARRSALTSMGRNGSLRWVDTLRQELLDTDRELQLEAIRAAGEMSLETLGKDLWRLTYSEDKDIMLAAIWSLGQTGWDGAFERLDELTLHKDSDVREVADGAMEEWLFYNGLGSGYEEDEPEELLDDEWDYSCRTFL